MQGKGKGRPEFNLKDTRNSLAWNPSHPSVGAEREELAAWEDLISLVVMRAEGPRLLQMPPRTTTELIKAQV